MAALNKLLLTVETVFASDLIIDILCSVTQLHEKLKNALQTTGLKDPGALEHVGALVFPAQYGDHVLNGPGQQFALQNPASGQTQFPPPNWLQLPPVDGFLDGPKQKPNGGALFPVLALLKILQLPGTTGFVVPLQKIGLNARQGQLGLLKFPQQNVPCEQVPTAF